MSERTHMIMEWMQGGYSTAQLARRYGVSRKTAHKWIGRYEQHQWNGLQERSRAPHHQSRALSAEVEQQILELKARWTLWGAPKLHHKLVQLLGEDAPCENTVGNVLKRHGLTRARRKARRAHGTGPLAHADEPNRVWCTDFKGWFRTGNGQRCQPLTITDGYSRYLLRCVGLAHSTGWPVVQPLFVAAFREYGLPQAIRSDNGAPFGSTGLCGLTPLSVWWIKLGIEVERIAPAHPEQNGRHERMHRTLKEATACPPCRNLRAQQEAFGRFQYQYNHERPHEALDFAVPAERYEPSPRAYPERLPRVMQYPEEWPTRAVRKGALIKWNGHEVRLTAALWGERVGFKPVADGLWELYFGSLLLGQFDERKMKVMRITPPPAPDVAGQAATLRSATCPATSANIPT